MIWFISDAHFGHRNIHLMGGRPISGPIENEYWISECWQQCVSRKVAADRADVVYCLGDMAFNEDALRLIQSLNGIKVLIGGNHDIQSPVAYETYREIHGLYKRYGMWLSHAPMHEVELRGKPNVHGHVHQQSINDPRYRNICPESLVLKFGRPMINLDELRGWLDEDYSPLHA